MIRTVPIIFLLLPFIVFWVYVRFAVGYRAKYGHGFYATHWYWVALIALLLCAASIIGLWAWSDHPGNGRYVPSHMEDGKLVPGQYQDDGGAP